MNRFLNKVDDSEFNLFGRIACILSIIAIVVIPYLKTGYICL